MKPLVTVVMNGIIGGLFCYVSYDYIGWWNIPIVIIFAFLTTAVLTRE